MCKKVSGLIICFTLLFALPFPAFAANQVNTMDIQAVIYEDGSMYVTWVREGELNEGTESYIPMNAPETLTISQLTVSDQNGSCETVPDWNIDWSVEEKARKCRIHILESATLDLPMNNVLLPIMAMTAIAFICSFVAIRLFRWE